MENKVLCKRCVNFHRTMYMEKAECFASPYVEYVYGRRHTCEEMNPEGICTLYYEKEEAIESNKLEPVGFWAKLKRFFMECGDEY